MTELNKGRILYGIQIIFTFWCLLAYIKYIPFLKIWFNMICIITLIYTIIELIKRIVENEKTWR